MHILNSVPVLSPVFVALECLHYIFKYYPQTFIAFPELFEVPEICILIKDHWY